MTHTFVLTKEYSHGIFCFCEKFPEIMQRRNGEITKKKKKPGECLPEYVWMP